MLSIRTFSLAAVVTAGVAVGVLNSSVAAEEHAEPAAVTQIHIDQYNGYFSSPNVFMGLKPGDYVFTVTNKAEKLVGFSLQDGVDHEQLAGGLIQIGETAEYQVTIDENGFRYSCPINPTPWYTVGVVSE